MGAERARIAVFAYGSLVSARSVAELLGRDVDGSLRAYLDGWRRRWSLKRHNLDSEKTFAHRDGGRKPTWILSLNVEPAEDSPAPNGLLIATSETELARIDVREMRYDRIDVTERVRLSAPSPEAFDRVFTYTAKPAHFAPHPPADAIILRSYLAAVEQAFTDLGEPELRAYAASTDPPPVEVAHGVLVADSIPAGNPREW